MSKRRRVQFNNGSNIKETLYNQDCIDLIIPIGTILPYAGIILPSNKFKFCDGEELSRGTYSKLFNIIGEKYGAGDGVLTFNLPNLIGRFLECTDNTSIVGKYKEAGLPEIEGYIYGNYLCSTTGNTVGNFNYASSGSGALRTWTQQNGNRYAYGAGSYWGAAIGFKASASNKIYGNSTTVQPKSLTVNYIIRVI